MPGEAVLVVDDDQLNRELLEAILSGDGFDVTLVSGGAEAIEALRQREFAAVLLDMLMPIVDGFDVIQFLIATQPRVLERVIVVSAMGDKFVANFDPTLVRGFIRKPVDRKLLLRTVRATVARPDPDATLA